MSTNKILFFLNEYNIVPKNIKIFLEAFTHRSFSNENPGTPFYQRLEFLGDALLNKLVAEKIFESFHDKDEGQMTLLRAHTVSGKTLSSIAKTLKLDTLIRFGKNALQLKKNPKILADVFESIVAAIYIDQGEGKLKDFLQWNVFNFLKQNENKILKNPKTIIQEILQSRAKSAIIYDTQKDANSFTSRLIQDGIIYGFGHGKTKKEAEIKAADDALVKCSKEEI